MSAVNRSPHKFKKGDLVVFRNNSSVVYEVLNLILFSTKWNDYVYSVISVKDRNTGLDVWESSIITYYKEESIYD